MDRSRYDDGASRSDLAVEEVRYFKLEDSKYMAVPLSEDLQIPTAPSGRLLVTVIVTDPSQSLNQHWLQGYVDESLKTDDVFRLQFLDGVIFITAEGQNVDLSQMAVAMLQSWGTSWSLAFPQSSLRSEECSGPHLLDHGKLYKAYRLYDDVNGAFMMATKPKLHSGSPFQNLKIGGDFYTSLSVAVSPRKSPGCALKGPLDGLRFAVKDVFEIEGLRVSAGNRAFYSLSQASKVTAPVLQKLIDAGAHLLGTTKLGSLIAREEPTEAVDFHAPFNPRADGYQSAWSSSGGSGAAIGAYDWLDFTIGTDTTGSSRRPAMANGCFQIRLSHDAISLEHVVPSFPLFDAPSLFGRDLEVFEKLIGAWLGSQPDRYKEHSISIVYLQDYLPIPNAEQMQLIDAFISDLESVHDTKARKLSIAEQWKISAPAETRETAIKDYLKDIGIDSFCYDVYHELDQFRAEYHAKYQKEPYVNPVTRWRWDIAQSIPLSKYDDAVHRMNVYKQWFLKEIMQIDKLNTLLVLPITKQAVDYRDVPPESPSAPDAFDSLWIAPILGAPEISLPIGEMKYHSRISKRNEYLPVVASLLGPPGSDMALISAAQSCLKGAGRPTRVSTGPRMFEE